MKNYTKLFFLALFFFILSAVSCKKTDSNEVVKGESKVKMVNAVLTEPYQNVFVDGEKLTVTALNFGETTDYVKISSGSRNVSFVNANNTSIIADLNFTPSITYTTFLISDRAGMKELIKYEDNLSNNESSKIKIKFINLTPYFNTGINVTLQAGTQFVNALQFKEESAYFTIDPGINLRFNVVGSGSIKTIDNASLMPNKIYTIWFSGLTAATLEAHIITDN
ncbi:DUF4397 domain-containing protein [Pedobacter mucosus]|uniref:DUF4397 domain-containing protein n=1 Tax=Pedobacter mucosus TaxID=2895286 RepID=UPI001EE3EF62|nr:DUF4397 domain-containing protein [Pedobacter mucosus]UKT64608.1 DUF4397 domain-containing protein [Pedobacter mucosus]